MLAELKTCTGASRLTDGLGAWMVNRDSGPHCEGTIVGIGATLRHWTRPRNCRCRRGEASTQPVTWRTGGDDFATDGLGPNQQPTAEEPRLARPTMSITLARARRLTIQGNRRAATGARRVEDTYRRVPVDRRVRRLDGEPRLWPTLRRNGRWHQRDATTSGSTAQLAKRIGRTVNSTHRV